MAKEVLSLQIDDDVPNEIATMVPTWLQSVLDWLVLQPPADPGRQPFYESLSFRVGMFGWQRGLQHSKTGRGWLYLQMSDIVCYPSRPTKRRYQSTFEDAFKANAAYLCSQHRGDQSYSDPGFNHEFHLAMQMSWLEEFLPDIADTIKAELAKERYESQFKQKRQLRQAAQREARRIKEPDWYRNKYKPTYGKAPAPLPPQAPPPPKQHPAPTVSAEDQRALDIIANHQEYMRSFCNLEDHDK